VKKVLFLAGMLACSSCGAEDLHEEPQFNTPWKRFVGGVTDSAEDVVRNVVGCGVVTAVSAGVASWWLPGKYVLPVAGALFGVVCALVGYKYRFVEVWNVADIGKHVNVVIVVNDDVTSLEGTWQSNAITQHIHFQGGNRLERIGAGVFYKFTNLQSIVIPDGVRSIGDSAFEHCHSLTTINSHNVEAIGMTAFHDCRSLINADLPNIKYINDGAFRRCTSLTNIASRNVESIGRFAFEGCKSLTNIILDNVKIIDDSAFYGCASLTDCNSARVEAIGKYAFFMCSSLTNIILGNVKTIGTYAFYECTSLTNCNSPKVETIGEYAFEWCESLTDLILDNVKTIGMYAFAHCRSLGNINLPESTQTIGDYAFYDCNLSSVNLPTTAKLGQNVFQKARY
jgi:hypothetical protein